MPKPTNPVRDALLMQFARDVIDTFGEDADENGMTHIESDEARAWFEAHQTDVFNDATAAIGYALDAQQGTKRAETNRLLGLVLGDVSADKLIELRDLVRALLIDYALSDVRGQITESLQLVCEERAEGRRRPWFRDPMYVAKVDA